MKDTAKVSESRIDKLVFDDKNFNKGTQYGEHLMDESVRKFGLGRSILLDKNNRIIAGNKTAEKAGELGYEKVIVVETDGDTLVAVKRNDIDLDSKKGRELALADNATSKANLSWDEDTLSLAMDEFGFDAKDWGVDFGDFGADPGSIETPKDNKGEEQEDYRPLYERFLEAPLSILSTRTGRWLERKRKWLRLGIASEVGRGENLTYASGAMPVGYYQKKAEYEKERGREVSHEEFNQIYSELGYAIMSGTSIFDPVVTEICYRWFCPSGGAILDPFAGGSVCGIVASVLGYSYTGNDIREEQVQANYENFADICNNVGIPNTNAPKWTIGDSMDIIDIVGNGAYDMIFSCPPYADLEVYSDNPSDISTMAYPEFLQSYREIIRRSCSMLKDNRFAVFVVSEVRSKKGSYYGFVADTIRAFEDAGLSFYNDIILENQVGSKSITASKPFKTSRKVSRVHQNILVFYKGDNPNKNIRTAFPEDIEVLTEVIDTENDHVQE